MGVITSRHGQAYHQPCIHQRNKVGAVPNPSAADRPSRTEICDSSTTKLAEVKRIASGIESQIATLTAYRKSLIHECVTGQRRVTEADVRRAMRAEGGVQKCLGPTKNP